MHGAAAAVAASEGKDDNDAEEFIYL